MKAIFGVLALVFTMNAQAEFIVSYDSAVTQTHREETDEVTSSFLRDSIVEISLRNWHSAPAVMRVDQAVIKSAGMTVEKFQDLMKAAATTAEPIVLDAMLIENAQQTQVDVIKINSFGPRK